MKKLLYVSILAIGFYACDFGGKTDKPAEKVPTEEVDLTPKNISYAIVNTFPRDGGNFTQGLEYAGDGKMLESAGQHGESDIRYTDIITGKVLEKTELDKAYFGEGCTQLNGKIYQLTYQEEVCFVYDAKTLKLVNKFPYTFGEGWGITNNGKDLIISNGSSNLFFVNPETFQEVKRVGVTNQYGPVANINELEMIKGFIYANVWQTDKIIKIDPDNGHVIGIIDLSDLRAKTGIPPLSMFDEKAPEVLNGIAYDSAQNRIFITGKYWPKLFEVKFDN